MTRPGHQLGPYQLGDEIGRGAAGIVYRATGPDGREVALKVLPVSDGEQRERFGRERRLLATLGEADGFVPLLDSGDSPRGPYLVMPFLRGGTLASRLERGALPLEEAIELGTALARALSRAHEKGIVHRDLKPGNVLFAADGRPLVADLGVAKHFRRDVAGASESHVISRSDGFRGTWGYMPPEQMRAAAAVGPPADVFAIGAILHECLAGRPAFVGETVFEVAGAVEAGRREPLERAAPGTPRWLSAAIRRALDPDPARRFPTAKELAQELEAGAGSPEVARSRARFVAAAAVLLGAAAAWLGRGETPPPAPSLSQGSPVVSRDAEVDRLAEAAGARAERGERAAALAELDALIARHPRNARAWAERGHVAFLARDHPRAVADSTRAIELDEKAWHGWFTRGCAMLLSGRPDKAIADLDRAVALAPHDARGYGNRGVAKVRSGDVQGGIRDLERAVELSPAEAPGWTNLALAYAEANDRRRAIEAVSKAIERDGKDASRWHDRGRWRHQEGDHARALADTIRACELAPRNAAHWVQRGDLSKLVGDSMGEAASYERAVALDPGHRSAWVNLANVRGRLGDLEGAIAAAKRALELDPRSANALRVIGIARAQRGEHRAAVEALDRAIAIDPTAKSAWFYRGIARQALGDEGAAGDFARYLELDPNGQQAPYARKQLAKPRGKP